MQVGSPGPLGYLGIVARGTGIATGIAQQSAVQTITVIAVRGERSVAQTEYFLQVAPQLCYILKNKKLINKAAIIVINNNKKDQYKNGDASLSFVPPFGNILPVNIV
jgi:hypothetical protein